VWPDPVERGNVTTNQLSPAVETTGHRWAADVVRPAPMLTPDGEPAMTDWSLQHGVRHLNHGSFGAVPLVAERAQTGFRQVYEDFAERVVPLIVELGRRAQSGERPGRR